MEQSVPIYRIALVREGALPVNRVASPHEIADLVRNYLKEPDREVVVVVMLSAKQEVIGINTVSIGTLESSLVHPREVFKPAVLLNAAAVVLAHNHPSGDATPSVEDHAVTKRLQEAGKLLGIELLDHLVLGGDTFISLRMQGGL